MADVVAGVEVGVVHPHRSAQIEGHAAHSLAVAGKQMELRRDQCFELLESRSRVRERADPGDVHVRVAVLDVEELGIEGAQAIHFRTDVRNLERDVVDPLTPLLDRLGNGSVGLRALQQFDLVRPGLEKGGDHPLALHCLTLVAGNAQQAGIDLLGGSEVLHGDADVFDTDHGMLLNGEVPKEESLPEGRLL